MNDKAVEAGARTIDPRAWEIMDDAKADMLKKYPNENIGYPAHLYQHAPSIKKAKACIQAYLAALPPAPVDEVTKLVSAIEQLLRELQYFAPQNSPYVGLVKAIAEVQGKLNRLRAITRDKP